MNLDFLDFEQPIAELEAKIDELRHVGSDAEINIQDELATLENKSRDLTESIFSNLKPWQISQVARHPLRPYFLDYVKRIFDDFEEMHGDRAYADDQAIVSGIARLEGMPVAIIGHQKGRDTKEKLHRNFGMPRPEGYRKALRIMETAERFKLPILTFIDTPGAYPGVGAEERGQSEAIARNHRPPREAQTDHRRAVRYRGKLPHRGGKHPIPVWREMRVFDIQQLHEAGAVVTIPEPHQTSPPLAGLWSTDSGGFHSPPR